MTASRFAQSYPEKAQKRLKILKVLFDDASNSDVVRESQEVVELSLKAMLRQIGVEPPKYHDVGAFLLEHAERFPEEVRPRLGRLAEISSWLRKEREFSL